MTPEQEDKLFELIIDSLTRLHAILTKLTTDLEAVKKKLEDQQ